MENFYSLLHKLLLVGFSFFVITTNAQQVTIVSADVNSYNVSPRGICQVGIMCTLPSVHVIMEAQILDAANEPLLTVKTNPFLLHSGMNVTANLNFTLNSIEYGNTALVTYIRNSNILPTGRYNYCVKIMSIGSSVIEPGEEYCQQLESDISSFLYLVNPEDKDTVFTENPVLIWNHSDPFNTLGPGEYYRLIVTPLNQGQSAEEAVTVNTPVYLKNNLEENQIQYPFDAPTLIPGAHYGWQVQLVANDAVINKTEAWEFIEAIHTTPQDFKYVVLKQSLDGGFYSVVNNKVFFRFDEPYASSGIPSCSIYDTKMQPVQSKVLDPSKKNNSVALKKHGYNQFEIDLNNMNVKSGFYYLEVKNGKGQKFMLKFYIN